MLHCPVCKSGSLYIKGGGYIGYIYRCKKCGYEGSFIIEYDNEDIDDEGMNEKSDG